MSKNFTKHQQKIIKNYYDNRDAISLQRLSELVTELYLAEGKARETAVEVFGWRAAEARDTKGSDRTLAQERRSAAARELGRRADGEG